ncbi:MAG TPA: alkaline phosphatase family protein [Blastocatellia bacterium]|nr:alkaline phosphatase family protein [Blastocatellia bacterium]
MSRSASGRLLVIGLDAGTWDILDPLVASGDMPRLGELLERSARGELLSTFPPTTSPAWPAMVTGFGPGKLGFFGLLNKRPGTQYEFSVARNTFDARSLWSLAGREGIPSVACGVPATFPPAESPNATVITGMLTPNGQPRTAPAAFESTLAANGLVIDWEELRNLERSVSLPDDEARLALFAMDTCDWRIFMTVFRSSDGIFHTHPAEADAHREMFRRIDAHIGEMTSRLTAHDTVMLVSDHGMTRLGEIVNINSLFWREGLLARRDVPASVEDRALGIVERIKTSPLVDNPIVKNPFTRRAAEALRQRRASKTLDFGREGRRQPRLSEALIDWQRTTCVFVDLGYGSGVYLNLVGREPLGIVDPADYDATRDRVAALLGRQPDVRVRRREDVYSGPFVERAPDLLVESTREDVGLSGRLLDVPVRQAVDAPYFHHTRRGIWAVAGPGVRPGVLAGPFNIVDVCPTALHLAGASVPDDLDGAVRLELFDPASEPGARPVRYVATDATVTTDDDVEYDDDAIKEKLRGLGYMH